MANAKGEACAKVDPRAKSEVRATFILRVRLALVSVTLRNESGCSLIPEDGCSLLKNKRGKSKQRTPTIKDGLFSLT